MKRRPPRPIVAALVPLLVLAACSSSGGDDGAAEIDEPVTVTAEEADGAPEPEEPGVAIEVAVTADGPVDGARRERVPVGEPVELTVTGDVTDEVHVHGYDLFAPIAPGQPATIRFDADIPGVFEVELEGSHVLILELEIS